MKVILSDEQIREAFHCPPHWDDCKKCDTGCIEIAKAQARHLFDLLNEPCTEHPNKVGVSYKCRKECRICIEEIYEEILKVNQ